MNELFDIDIHPGRPKILFIGFPESSHTHSWIELLDGREFNVRLFALPSAEPHEGWAIKTYLTRTGAPWFDNATRKTVFPPPESSSMGLVSKVKAALDRGQLGTSQRLRRWIESGVRLAEKFSRGKHALTIEEALARVIQQWQPDIIHTLGFDSASYFYLRTRKQFSLSGIGRWVAQARGGPDIALQRYSPDSRKALR